MQGRTLSGVKGSDGVYPAHRPGTPVPCRHCLHLLLCGIDGHNQLLGCCCSPDSDFNDKIRCCGCHLLLVAVAPALTSRLAMHCRKLVFPHLHGTKCTHLLKQKKPMLAGQAQPGQAGSACELPLLHK
jgi:hypothetical protein